jgi:hypothetical protein
MTLMTQPRNACHLGLYDVLLWPLAGTTVIKDEGDLVALAGL